MAVHELFGSIKISDVNGLQSALDGKASASALATLVGRVDGHDTAISGKANDSEVVHKTGNESISGNKSIPSGSTWTFDTAPLVAVGTNLANPVRRDDSRLTDSRSPLPHAHSASDITSGTLDAARLPKLNFVQNAVTLTGGQTFTPSADAVTAPQLHKVTMTTATTANNIAVPSGTPQNGQVIKYHLLASGGIRNVAFNASYRVSNAVTSRSIQIPSGQMLIAITEYSDFLGAWVLTATSTSA